MVVNDVQLQQAIDGKFGRESWITSTPLLVDTQLPLEVNDTRQLIIGYANSAGIINIRNVPNIFCYGTMVWGLEVTEITFDFEFGHDISAGFYRMMGGVYSGGVITLNKQSYKFTKVADPDHIGFVLPNPGMHKMKCYATASAGYITENALIDFIVARNWVELPILGL